MDRSSLALLLQGRKHNRETAGKEGDHRELLEKLHYMITLIQTGASRESLTSRSPIGRPGLSLALSY